MEDIRRLITVELFTDSFRYIGDIVIIGMGHNKRLTDYLNSSQPFIPILSPKLYTITGDLIREEDIIILNKSAIKFVIPLEEAEEKIEERTKKYIDSEKYFKEYVGTPEQTPPPPTRRLRLSSAQEQQPQRSTLSNTMPTNPNPNTLSTSAPSPTQRLKLRGDEPNKRS